LSSHEQQEWTGRRWTGNTPPGADAEKSYYFPGNVTWRLAVIALHAYSLTNNEPNNDDDDDNHGDQ
jgi:hypothetical protein